MPGVPVYSLLLVCFLPLQSAHEAAGAAGTRHSPRPLLGERFMHNSGASRREIAKLRRQYSSCHHPRRRVIQYSGTPVMESKGRGVLDTPLEPVIGLAEGETRWRGMTALLGTGNPRI